MDSAKTPKLQAVPESLDDLDRAILNEIQSSFPIVSRPYAEVGVRVGADEEQVLGRVRNLMESGVIRRLGANFTSRKLGYTSTLCAARVPPESLERFVEVVNRYPGVTHNYLRRHHFNVWFTLIAESPAASRADPCRDLRGLRGGDPEPAGRGNLQDQSRFSPLNTIRKRWAVPTLQEGISRSISLGVIPDAPGRF